MRALLFACLSLSALVGCGSRSPLDVGSLTDTGAPPPSSLHEVVLTGLGGMNTFETWTFDATHGWLHLDVDEPVAPGEGEGFPSVVAAGGSRVVLWGSFAGEGTATWTFDGDAWREIGAEGPSPRSNPAFASLGDRVVMFGGLDDTGYLDDTWLFDGATWTNAHGHAPPARERASFAQFDGKLVLFGGDFGDSGQVFDDTWTYDGTEWREARVGTPRPSSRTGAALAPLDGELVLFGGQVPPNGQLGDTWSFDGRRWKQLQPGGSPPAQSSALLTPLGEQLVLFGQTQPFAGVPWDDTWLYGSGSWLDAGTGGPLFSSQQPAMATIDRD